MKIIYYSPHPTHDIVSEVGYSTHQRESIQAMRSLGHEVLPVIMGGTEKAAVADYHRQMTTQSRWKQLALKWLPEWLLNGLKDIRLMRHDALAAARLKEAILQFKPNLVYERNEYMQNKGTRLCHVMGVLHFLEINAPAVEEMRAFEGPSILHHVALHKERNKIKTTNRIFVVSSALKEYIEKKYHPQVPVEVVPNGINPETRIPEAGEISDIRKKLGWKANPVFGFIGSIFPYHGVDKLIRAFSQVIKDFPDARLLVVGDGKKRSDYELLASGLLPSGSYFFAGKVPHADALAYIGAFDVAIMPDSNWYGSPVKILEYGWMQKPIIAPDLAPLRDLMVHQVDGILVGRSVEDLAAAMGTTISNMEKSREMGRHFYRKIQNEFTWKEQTRRILSSCG